MALFRFTDAIMRGDAIELYDRGEPRRDFTYIDDVADGISSVLERPPCGDPDWDGRQSSISPAPPGCTILAMAAPHRSPSFWQPSKPNWE